MAGLLFSNRYNLLGSAFILDFWKAPADATSRKSIKKELQVEDKQKIKTLAIAAKKSETHIDKSSVCHI